MTGSRSTGFAFLAASWNASEPAIEGHLRRVDVVVRPVVEHDADVDHRVAGEDAAREGLLDPFVDRLDELRGNRTADGHVLEHVAGAGLARIEMDLRMRVLAATARLLGVLDFAVGGTRQRLFVGNLRTPDARLDVELAFQAVDDALEVQFAHAADDDLPGRLARVHADRGVFGQERVEAAAESFLIRPGIGLDGER
jgi:hypothetical protein